MNSIWNCIHTLSELRSLMTTQYEIASSYSMKMHYDGTMVCAVCIRGSALCPMHGSITIHYTRYRLNWIGLNWIELIACRAHWLHSLKWFVSISLVLFFIFRIFSSRIGPLFEFVNRRRSWLSVSFNSTIATTWQPSRFTWCHYCALFFAILFYFLSRSLIHFSLLSRDRDIGYRLQLSI